MYVLYLVRYLVERPTTRHGSPPGEPADTGLRGEYTPISHKVKLNSARRPDGPNQPSCTPPPGDSLLSDRRANVEPRRRTRWPRRLKQSKSNEKCTSSDEGAPYHCLDVEVSKPTARGGQTLVRLKMRNLLTRAVFDKTFKAGDKFKEPDLARVEAIYQYADGGGFHFMDQDSFETLTLRVGDGRRRRRTAGGRSRSCRSTSSTAIRSACSSRRSSR